MSPSAPRRVAVTHPRTTAARRRTPVSAGHDRASSAGSDDVLIRSLIAAQLRLSLLIGAGALAILVGIPLLILSVPALQEATVARVPVAWLALALGVFPAIIVGAWIYVRAAERTERRFLAMQDDS